MNGVVSSDHVHLFVSIPPTCLGERLRKESQGAFFTKKSNKNFPRSKKGIGDVIFGREGFFSATSGNVTDDVINEYINNHGDANEPESISRIQLE